MRLPLRGWGVGIGWLLATAGLAVLPALLPEYPRFVLSLTLVNAIAAMGVNLSMGYGGQVSVGHAGFAAIGAYTTAILMGRLDVSFWTTLPVGGALAILCGILIGLPALKLTHLYIAMVTFGFGQVVNLISLNWVDLTNGPNGLPVPPISLGGYVFSPDSFYYVIAAFLLVLFWVAGNIVRSRMGRGFLAIRDSEVAAESMGVHLAKYKTIAFAVGAFYGGISGALYAGLSNYVNPDAFIFPVSVLYLTMNVVGGMGTLAGPVVGALVFTVMPELLRGFAEYKEFLSGGLLLLFLVFFPEGLVGMFDRLGDKLGRRGGRSAPAGTASATDVA